MFRRRKPVWKNPELSVGSKSETRIGGMNCYEAVGEVCRAFLDVAGSIKILLDDNKDELERGEQKQSTVAFYIFMIGSDPRQSQPTIIFASRSKRQRTMAKVLVKEQDLLARYPGIRLETLPQLPAVPRAPSKPSASYEKQTGSYESMEGEQTCEIVGKPDYLCGALLQCGESQATLGGIIRIGSRLYGTTAFHAGLSMPNEEEEPAGELVFDMVFDSDSEEDFDATSHGSKSSDPDLDPNTSDSGDPPLGLSSSSSTTISAHNKPQKRSVHKSSGRKSGKLPHQDLPTLSRRLDYRLVPLDERPRHGNEVHLSGSAAGQILRPNNIVQTPTLGNTSVWVATAISGPVMGSLLRCPRFIKMAGWPTFEEVWVVKLERPSYRGDCGAWVLDADTGDLYGHITAGDPQTHDAYMLPAYKIFDDIKTSQGTVPSLQLDIQDQQASNIQQGSNLVRSPSPQDSPNRLNARSQGSHRSSLRTGSLGYRPPPPPAGGSNTPFTLANPAAPNPATARASQPRVSFRGHPIPSPVSEITPGRSSVRTTPAKERENRLKVRSRAPPPPSPIPMPDVRGPPPPPSATRAGDNRSKVNTGDRPAPPPMPTFNPRGPSPPPSLGLRETVKISDIRPVPVLTKEYCRQQLTTYELYTLRKAAPVSTVAEKAHSEKRKLASKPTWERVLITREAFDQKDIIKQIKDLDKKSPPVTTKRIALFPNQQTQISKLIDEKAAAESDSAFTWTLVQLDRKEVTNRSTGNRETQTMSVYLKRALTEAVDPISIFNSIEMGKKRDINLSKSIPNIETGSLGSQEPGSKTAKNNTELDAVIKVDAAKDTEKPTSIEIISYGKGGRKQRTFKQHKNRRPRFEDGSSSDLSYSDYSMSSSDSDTGSTTMSSSPSTRRSTERTGSNRRERNPYRVHERLRDDIQPSSITYVPDLSRVPEVRGSGYSSRRRDMDSRGIDYVAAEAYAAGVVASTRAADRGRYIPSFRPDAPRSSIYDVDLPRRNFTDDFGALHSRDELSLDSHLRAREDRSFEYFDAMGREDVLNPYDMRRLDLEDRMRRDSIPISGRSSGSVSQLPLDAERGFNYDQRNPFAPDLRRWDRDRMDYRDEYR